MLSNAIKALIINCVLFSISQAQIKPVLELKVHEDVIDTLVLSNELVYTGSYDGYVKSIHIISHKISNILKKDDWIRSLLIVNNELIVAANDGSITGVCLKSNAQKWKLDAHDSWITGLAFTDGKLISISMDEHVKVWDISTKKQLFDKKIYGSHKHQSICIANNQAIIGSTSIFSKLSLKNYDLHKVYDFGLSNAALSCSYQGGLSPVGLSNGDVLIFGKDRIQKKIHKGAIKAIVQIGNDMYTASDDGKIYKSNIRNLEKRSLVYSSDQKVSALNFDHTFLYAGFADGSIRIFYLKDMP